MCLWVQILRGDPILNMVPSCTIWPNFLLCHVLRMKGYKYLQAYTFIPSMGNAPTRWLASVFILYFFSLADFLTFSTFCTIPTQPILTFLHPINFGNITQIVIFLFLAIWYPSCALFCWKICKKSQLTSARTTPKAQWHGHSMPRNLVHTSFTTCCEVPST